MDRCNLCNRVLNKDEKDIHEACQKLFKENSIGSDIYVKAINQAKQLEAEGIRKHFLSLGCKLKLYQFIDGWYDKHRKYKKDTVDEIWERFVKKRMNPLNGLDNTNINSVRIFFERPEERKNVNKSTRRHLENLMLLDCSIKPCYACMDFTVLEYSRYFETIYAKCLKCGKKYKNI